MESLDALGLAPTTLLKWLLAAAVLAWAAWVYNRLVRLRNEIANAFAQIDVQLKRRYDLVPNLVEVARKYLQHERETLEAVTAARNTARAAADRAKQAPADPGLIGALAAADGVLGGALGRLMAVAEAYPELKADKTMRELSEELTHTENRVAFARQAFNDAVLDHNNAVQHFPSLIVARLTGFRPAAMLEATASDEERRAPRVQF
ncbi:LemA family protein [Azohydromonas sediminis]|uniref:LemA family protein n=1 Tax=Azohydromonas sediminis TaxID=2259674 RepID=UPI000E648630|nr:LemA family protein [Azohydromonas sediminis]